MLISIPYHHCLIILQSWTASPALDCHSSAIAISTSDLAITHMSCSTTNLSCSLEPFPALHQHGEACGAAGEAPDLRRAAAGALFAIPNTTSKQLLIHGGRLEAGHILEDLWQATLGTGNVTYQQLWPPQRDSADNKKKPRGPAARKGHSAIAIQKNDPCLVRIGQAVGQEMYAVRLDKFSTCCLKFTHRCGRVKVCVAELREGTTRACIRKCQMLHHPG